MSAPRPPTAPAPLGRYNSGGRSSFDDLGPGPRHHFQAPPFEADIGHRHNPNARPGLRQTQRPHSYHPQIHQELPHSGALPGAGAQPRASGGRSFPPETGYTGGGQRVNPVLIQGSPPVTRYVCFQKRSNSLPWKNEWETCKHITMSIGPEETEKQIRRHDEPGKDIGTCISKLGKYQLRHLRMQEDKLNTSEKDPKNFKWVISAVGKEKKQSGGGASQTFWAIYSRQSRFRPTTASGKAPLPRAQTLAHPTEPARRQEQPYDGPIVVQSVEIPAPPRPVSFSGGRPVSFSGRPTTAGGYPSGQYFQSDFMPEAFATPVHPGQHGANFGPQHSHDVNPVRQAFPQFSGPGPQLREIDPGSGRPVSFSQFPLVQPVDPFLRSSGRAPPVVEAQNFGYQQPHSAEPRASMPTIPTHRPQSNRVDQPFQPEVKRSPHRADSRLAKQQHQRAAPQQDQRRKRSSSMAAPRVRQERPDSHYQDHADTRKNRRSALELPDYPEDKMNRTDRWVESSISGSSGLGTSTVGSGDGGSVVGEYTLNPPPMGRRRNSISTYAGKNYYQNSSPGGLTRGRSINEGARNRRNAEDGYYLDLKPSVSVRRATQDYDIQYATNTRGRRSPKYVGYNGPGRKRSQSRKRSRSRHHGDRDSDSCSYDYESADEMQENMRNLRIDSSTTRRGPSRPHYRRHHGLVEYGG